MGISVSINAGADSNSSSIITQGSVQQIITDFERTAFNIQDTSLRNAVATYCNGKEPDNVYLFNPTKYDLYDTYNWPQVQSTLSVQSANILDANSTPELVASQEFVNNSSVAADFECAITQQKTTSIESSWSSTSMVGEGQTVSYSIGFSGSSVSGETAMNYNETWETQGSQSELITLGMSSGVTAHLQPGEKVTADLMASKGNLTVQIVYQLTLSGCVAVTFGSRYNGHYFWGFDINSVMESANLPSVLTTTETIEIDFYVNSTITLKDTNGQTMALFRPNAIPGL